ncbi:hypothetical protein EGT74_15590 [Chitinophaga lutea]|uniref:Uncharacterized protein n=2 Tax=Chitinophaga lutea TaxID=2488634 RepID=A0A3N4PWN7_9BACT|nr:hypothetical protein EGT74_15590 [Chitinophaga lutea]
MSATPKKQEELKGMLLEGRHPVLRQLRRQVVIEVSLFTAFLLMYYSIFDGDRKPVLFNVLLVVGVLFVIGHSIFGYFNSRRAIRTGNLREALNVRLKELKTYAWMSVLFRSVSTVFILLYFSMGIGVSDFTMEKQVILLGAILILVIQLGVKTNMWLRRIRRLGRVAGELGGD